MPARQRGPVLRPIAHDLWHDGPEHGWRCLHGGSNSSTGGTTLVAGFLAVNSASAIGTTGTLANSQILTFAEAAGHLLVAVVPEPSAVVLLMSGVAGVAAVRRRFR